MRWVSAGAVLVTLVLLMGAGCANATQRGTRRAKINSHASALPSWLHRIVHATAYVSPAAPLVPHVQSVGAPVPRSDVTTTVSENGSVKFGLATFPSSTQTYPVISTDSGASWKIDGPLFHVDAAQGASVVASIGALRPHGAYFWGRGGNVIWITRGSGAHWLTAAFAGGVERVSETKGILAAVALGDQVNHGTAVQRFLYESTDSATTWKLRRRLANLRTAG